MLRANQLTISRQGNTLLDYVSCEIASNQTPTFTKPPDKYYDWKFVV